MNNLSQHFFDKTISIFKKSLEREIASTENIMDNLHKDVFYLKEKDQRIVTYGKNSLRNRYQNFQIACQSVEIGHWRALIPLFIGSICRRCRLVQTFTVEHHLLTRFSKAPCYPSPVVTRGLIVERRASIKLISGISDTHLRRSWIVFLRASPPSIKKVIQWNRLSLSMRNAIPEETPWAVHFASRNK